MFLSRPAHQTLTAVDTHSQHSKFLETPAQMVFLPSVFSSLFLKNTPKNKKQGRVDPGAIRAQQAAARAGAVIAGATAASLVGLSLKDTIMGVGGGDYDEDY